MFYERALTQWEAEIGDGNFSAAQRIDLDVNREAQTLREVSDVDVAVS